PRIAFRDVTNRTNRRTLICALIPGGRLTVQTAPWVLWLQPEHPREQEAFLLGVMSSIIADWWVRRFVEGHVDEEAFNSLPVPVSDPRGVQWRRTVHLAGRLSCQDDRFSEWSEKVGVECGPLPEDKKQDMMAQLDAVVAHLFGLNEKQLVHIFETFH